MKKINRLLLATLLTFYFGTTYSQTTDSLSVFPNPFVSSTTIHFDLVQSDTITLRVFNLFGQTTRTYFQSTILPSGSYNINFLGDSLQDGIYFVRLDIGSTKSITKKAVKSCSTAIVEDNRVVNKLIVFPNPANEILCVESEKEIHRIELCDVMGKTIYTVQGNGNLLINVPVKDFAKGTYLVKVFDQNNSFTTKKLSINH